MSFHPPWRTIPQGEPRFGAVDQYFAAVDAAASGSRLGRIHDWQCRCRTCKPPLVGAAGLSRRKLAILVLAVALGWIAMFVLYAVGKALT